MEGREPASVSGRRPVTTSSVRAAADPSCAPGAFGVGRGNDLGAALHFRLPPGGAWPTLSSGTCRRPLREGLAQPCTFQSFRKRTWPWQLDSRAGGHAAPRADALEVILDSCVSSHSSGPVSPSHCCHLGPRHLLSPSQSTWSLFPCFPSSLCTCPYSAFPSRRSPPLIVPAHIRYCSAPCGSSGCLSESDGQLGSLA